MDSYKYKDVRSKSRSYLAICPIHPSLPLSKYLLIHRTSTGQGRPATSHKRPVREKRRRTERLINHYWLNWQTRKRHYYEKTRLAKSCDVWILYACACMRYGEESDASSLLDGQTSELKNSRRYPLRKSTPARVSLPPISLLLETRQRRVDFDSGLLRDAKASSRIREKEERDVSPGRAE